MSKKRWTPEEAEQVKQGKIPETRTYAQAASYAHAHGIAWRALRTKDNPWYWSDEEKALLAKGEIPRGRTEAACRQACRMYGIKREALRKFSHEELVAAAKGSSTIPQRELERLCSHEGITMRVSSLPRNSSRRLRAEALIQGKSYVRKQFLQGPMTRSEYIWLMHESGVSYREIGRRLKITGTRAQSLASAYESQTL